MSHNIMYDTYPENVDKGRVQKSWDNYVAIADRGEGASGLPGQIRWLSTVCDSEDEAHDYIRSVDSGNYDQIAVRFRRAAAPLPSCLNCARSCRKRRLPFTPWTLTSITPTQPPSSWAARNAAPAWLGSTSIPISAPCATTICGLSPRETESPRPGRRLTSSGSRFGRRKRKTTRRGSSSGW